MYYVFYLRVLHSQNVMFFISYITHYISNLYNSDINHLCFFQTLFGFGMAVAKFYEDLINISFCTQSSIRKLF